MANTHPGSYSGQDAYNDMFITEKKNERVYRERTDRPAKTEQESWDIELYARPADNNPGGEMEKTIVRRLTPLECERLQGFPDGWTDIGEWTDTKGKLHKESSDSARYKALGNAIAIPYWRYLARRIVAQYEHEVTMGSLFDGIGGFPYVFEQCGCKAVWASEIEEFPIAVTKVRFPEKEEDEQN